MSIVFYGDIEKAAKIAGVNSSVITTEQQEVINEWIKANIKWSGFEQSSEITEYYDIKRHSQAELILNHFPVISVKEIINRYGSTAPLTLTDGMYVVDNESGIIQMLDSCNPQHFSQGVNTVKVTYTYGYAAVPDIIANISNLMLAKWLKILDQQTDADGLKSVRIGDYSESKDVEFLGIKSEFDEILLPMIKRAKIFYNDGI